MSDPASGPQPLNFIDASAAAALAVTVLAVDPGRSKCGVAVVEGTRSPSSSEPPPAATSTFRALRKQVTATDALLLQIAKLMREFPIIDTLVIGDGTQSATLRKAAAAMFPALKIAVVNEHGSSQRARARYVREHPPRGWQRLLPAGMRAPETCYDDTVAEILAEEYLQSILNSW